MQSRKASPLDGLPVAFSLVEQTMSILKTVIDAVTSPSNEDEVDAIELLKADHEEVDKLFKEYELLADGAKDDTARRDLSTQICGMLAVHAMIEEEIFYPAARAAKVDSALLDEATIEHGSAKHLIAEIGAAQASDSLYDARVKVLGEYIRHHVKEEEGQLFPACRKSEMDLEAVGVRLEKRKAQLMRKLAGQ